MTSEFSTRGYIKAERSAPSPDSKVISEILQNSLEAIRLAKKFNSDIKSKIDDLFSSFSLFWPSLLLSSS